MNLSKNFSLSELTLSQNALRAGISNEPSKQVTDNLSRLAKELLQPIRDLIGTPVSISSGYRSVAVNKMAGGSSTSAHCLGFAADLNSYSYGSSKQLAKFIAVELKKRSISFDQIILEYDAWVHVGLFNHSGQQRGQVLTARKVGNKTVYLQGIV